MNSGIIAFFENLPPKLCANCGKQIEEQHECYGNTCFSCIGLKDLD